MVKQWVQPPGNKNRLPPGGFLLRVPSHKFYFYFYFKGFHWNVRGKVRNPVFGIILHRF